MSFIWPMGYSFIHSLSKSQYINKTLVLFVLMENFKYEQMQLVVFWSLWKVCHESFEVGTFFSIPVLTFHYMETSSLMPCWKAPFSCLCPFLCPVLVELRGNQKYFCRRKQGRWKWEGVVRIDFFGCQDTFKKGWHCMLVQDDVSVQLSF